MAEGYVYFVHAPSAKLIKIGYTAGHPDGRFSTLEAVSPVPLVKLGYVPGGQPQEYILHKRFVAFRVHHEWFEESDDLWAYIRQYVLSWPERNHRVVSWHGEDPFHARERQVETTIMEHRAWCRYRYNTNEGEYDGSEIVGLS